MFAELFLAFLCLTASSVEGFSRGAPAGHCPNGIPKHGVNAQTTAPPYVILLDKSEYSPGENITVTIKGQTNETFVGFQLHAHRTDTSPDTQEVIGQFVQIPYGAQGQGWFTPENVEYNCVTHNNKTIKQELVFVWQAPPKTEGDLVFSGPIVQNFTTFWLTLTSAVLKARETYTPGPFPAKINPDFNQFDFLNNCEKTKQCFRSPSDCTGEDCEYAAAYSPINDGKAVRIELLGKTENYISIGFSKDKLMGEDFVGICSNADGRLVVQNAYNPSHHTSELRIAELSDIHIAYQNGLVYCSFVRDTVLQTYQGGTRNIITSDLKDPHYIFLARGKVYEGTTIISKHVDAPKISDKTVKVMKVPDAEQQPSTAANLFLNHIVQVSSVLLSFWVTLSLVRRLEL